MALPTPEAVNNAASYLGANPLHVYAYAYYYQQVPQNVPNLNSFEASVHSVAASLHVNDDLVFGYVQGNGVFPDGGHLITWAQNHNYMDNTGAEIKSPPAGADYPGATATPPGGSTPTTPPATGFDLSSLTKNPTVLIVGGAALAALFLFGGRRR